MCKEVIYRIDALPNSTINPFTLQKYDHTWMALTLDYSTERRIVSGVGEEGVYLICISKILTSEWAVSVGDFIDYCIHNNLNGILAISEKEYNEVITEYNGHSYDDPFLRIGEPDVLINSTGAGNWEKIKIDGSLKSWNRLKSEIEGWEDHPIGDKLGDIPDFQNYIMFGGGVTGEIVVSSKQSGFVNMNINAEYHTGARMYFDARKIAENGLLIRDGIHIKVKDSLPLDPYLIWVATWDVLGLSSPISTPKCFAEIADEHFKQIRNK